ncbi:MAG: hypothetical protein M3R40_05310 [Pseudomonadota bacterium]|nr:hypothetical protein [Pseudomonadota bacterium]
MTFEILGYIACAHGRCLAKRFGKRYCLNPEVSLHLHTGDTVALPKIVVATKLGGNSLQQLPHGTSLLMYQDEARAPKTRVERRGLQVFPPAEALCRVGPHWFEAYPRIALLWTDWRNAVIDAFLRAETRSSSIRALLALAARATSGNAHPV